MGRRVQRGGRVPAALHKYIFHFSPTKFVLDRYLRQFTNTGKLHSPLVPFRLQFPGTDLGGKVSSHLNFPL